MKRREPRKKRRRKRRQPTKESTTPATEDSSDEVRRILFHRPAATRTKSWPARIEEEIKSWLEIGEVEIRGRWRWLVDNEAFIRDAENIRAERRQS